MDPGLRLPRARRGEEDARGVEPLYAFDAPHRVTQIRSKVSNARSIIEGP